MPVAIGPHRRFHAGLVSPEDGAEIERMYQEAERLSQITTQPPIQMLATAGGYALRMDQSDGQLPGPVEYRQSTILLDSDESFLKVPDTAWADVITQSPGYTIGGIAPVYESYPDCRILRLTNLGPGVLVLKDTYAQGINADRVDPFQSKPYSFWWNTFNSSYGVGSFTEERTFVFMEPYQTVTLIHRPTVLTNRIDPNTGKVIIDPETGQRMVEWGYWTLMRDRGVAAGTINLFGSDRALPGWLRCDGAVYSKLDYPRLYAAIGIYHTDIDPLSPLFVADAGDPWFAVPDIRSRGLVFGSLDSNLPGYYPSITSGVEHIELATSDTHEHTYGDDYEMVDVADTDDVGDPFVWDFPGEVLETDVAGAPEDIDVRPPFIAYPYWIKT